MKGNLKKASSLEFDAEYLIGWANSIMFKIPEIFESREYNPYCETSHPSDIEHNVFNFSTYIAFFVLIFAIFAMLIGGPWGILQWGMLVVGIATLPVCLVYGVRAAISGIVKLYAKHLKRKASRLRKEYFKESAHIQDFFMGTKEIAKKLDYTPASKEDTIQKYEIIIKAIEKLVAKMKFDKKYDALKNWDERDAIVDEVLREINFDPWQKLSDREREHIKELVGQCLRGSR
ncbi:MAG: hypothetical protein J5613_04135 [Alphaproteobacteria bacterium]|nr:hypothetical protein [Alphaproteobacteria bacterium]